MHTVHTDTHTKWSVKRISKINILTAITKAEFQIFWQMQMLKNCTLRSDALVKPEGTFLHLQSIQMKWEKYDYHCSQMHFIQTYLGQRTRWHVAAAHWAFCHKMWFMPPISWSEKFASSEETWTSLEEVSSVEICIAKEKVKIPSEDIQCISINKTAA